MSKVEKRHLTDQVFHTRGDVLKAGRRKKPNECGRIPEIRVQGESVFVSDHVGIIVGKNRRCKRIETGSRASTVYPDVATSNPGRGTSKPLQLRIFRKSRVTEDLTLREVPVLPKNPCSRLPKVPPCLRRSGFAQAGARLWENTRRIVRRLPGEAAQYPRPVSILLFLQLAGLWIVGAWNLSPMDRSYQISQYVVSQTACQTSPLIRRRA